MSQRVETYRRMVTLAVVLQNFVPFFIQGEQWRTQYPPVEEPSSYQDCLKFAIAGTMVAERKAIEGEVIALAEAHGVEIEKDKSAFSSDED